jgi:hypothetical protein
MHLLLLLVVQLALRPPSAQVPAAKPVVHWAALLLQAAQRRT